MGTRRERRKERREKQGMFLDRDEASAPLSRRKDACSLISPYCTRSAFLSTPSLPHPLSAQEGQETNLRNPQTLL